MKVIGDMGSALEDIFRRGKTNKNNAFIVTKDIPAPYFYSEYQMAHTKNAFNFEIL